MENVWGWNQNTFKFFPHLRKGIHYTDLVLELRDPPASASQVLGLKMCSTIAQQESKYLK